MKDPLKYAIGLLVSIILAVSTWSLKEIVAIGKQVEATKMEIRYLREDILEMRRRE